MKIPTQATVLGAAVALLAGAPFVSNAQEFKSAWKSEVSADAKRMAIADVTGDQKPRLLLLEKDNTLTINAISDAAVKKEASVDLGKNALQFAAGTFAKGKPAVIAVPGGIFYKDGDKYSRKDSSEVSEITGLVRFVDGTENFFFFGGEGDPATYAVDLAGAKTVVKGSEMPDPMAGEGTYSAVIARFGASALSKFGLPDEVQKSGVFGFFAPKGSGKLVGIATWTGKDTNNIGTFDLSSLHSGGGGDFKFGWKSPKLEGAVLDFSIGPDPKTGKGVGIYILLKTGPEGKGRAVEYFTGS